MRENCLQHALAIAQHFIVPKAKHLPALAFQIGVPRLVARALGVLETVSLDDQLSANAKNVDNVGADRNLSPELESAKATIAQKTPEAKLGVGRRSAHRSSAGALVRRDTRIGLHRSSNGGAALIRRFAPPSPRGRRGASPQSGPPLLSEKRRRSPPLLPPGEGGRRSRADEGAWLRAS
jgi:hypothetical protein